MGIKFFEVGDVPYSVSRIAGIEEPIITNNIPAIGPDRFSSVRFSPTMYNPETFLPFRKVMISFRLNNEFVQDASAYAPLDALAECKALLMESLSHSVDEMFLTHPDIHHQHDDDMRRQLRKVSIAREVD